MDGDKPILAALRREIARVAPDLKGEPVAWLGEGMDHVAVLVGDRFVFRFPKHREAAQGLRHEIALLPRLAPTLLLAIPRLQYVGEQADTGMPFVGYPLLHGEPLERACYEGLPRAKQQSILADLAAFLTALHRFPMEEAASCGLGTVGNREDYVHDLRRAQEEVYPLLDDAVRRSVDSRLAVFVADDANFAFVPRLLHADLWPEHVLVEPREGRLAGIIDFADISLGDPDYDWAFLAHRLGSDFRVGLLRHSAPRDPEWLANKLQGFALFNMIGDALTGLEHNDQNLLHAALADLAQQCKAERLLEATQSDSAG
jgi:aminoglycoside 2''-phosphotransferase